MAKLKKMPGGKVGLGRNMTWAERQAAGARPKKERGPSKGQWARNSKDATKRAEKGGKGNLEDSHIRGKRIRDVGQAVPKGYMRTGGRYFAKIANMRPIQSKTSDMQKAFFYANKDRFLGPDGKGGWMRSLSNQGMYNGTTSEGNFRKTSSAKRMMDKDKVYNGYGTTGKKKASKSRYIMAIGQDGHAR